MFFLPLYKMKKKPDLFILFVFFSIYILTQIKTNEKVLRYKTPWEIERKADVREEEKKRKYIWMIKYKMTGFRYLESQREKLS